MLDAVYRWSVGEAESASQNLELAQLSSTMNLAWCKAMAQAADELPVSQVNSWTKVFERVKMPGDDTSSASTTLKMTRLRLVQLAAATDAERGAALATLKQLAQENASDPQLQLGLAAGIAQSATDATSQEARWNDAIKIVKRVAVGTKKESEAHLRARWLEARWQVGKSDNAAASQVARLTLASATLKPSWWQTRFEKLASP
jgi:hypothetical protein